MEHIVSVGSYENDLIVDPFAGSLTTGVAVEKVGGRNALLVEENQEYIDVGRGRINDV